MRLSDVRGERVFDVIAEIVDPVASIATDEKVTPLFSRSAGGTDRKAEIIERLRVALPVLMREHKDDLCTILASIQGVTKEEYEDELSMSKLMSDVFELLTDREFIGFFE